MFQTMGNPGPGGYVVRGDYLLQFECGVNPDSDDMRHDDLVAGVRGDRGGSFARSVVRTAGDHDDTGGHGQLHGGEHRNEYPREKARINEARSAVPTGSQLPRSTRRPTCPQRGASSCRDAQAIPVATSPRSPSRCRTRV